MGRGAKPPGVDPGRAQGTLLGFLSRAPLAPADANEERPLRSARVEKAGDGHASAGAGEPRADPPAASARPAPGTTSSLARATAETRAPPSSPSRRVPPRVADALVRIARAINGWERLADATLRRASDDDEEARSRRARRTSSAIASLVARAYEHRVGERARSRPPRAPPIARWTTAPSLASLRDAGGSSRRKRAFGAALERSAHALSLARVTELGVCHLPSPPTASAAVSASGDAAVRTAFSPAGGSTLAVATASGFLGAFRTDILRESDGERYAPVLARRGLGDSGSVARSLSSLAWASDGLYVATTSGDADSVEIVDVAAGRAARVVHAGAARDGAGGSTAAFAPRAAPPALGLLDASFFPGESKSKIVASGRRGTAFLWDARCAGGAPRAELAAPKDPASPFTCVRVSDDGQTVFAGTGAGYVHVWDARGGTVARAAAFSVASRNKVSHQLLRSVDVVDVLAAAPSLRGIVGTAGTAGTGRSSSAVHWCEPDPHAPGRLGFHLACGWSGVLDLLARGGPAATHAHCPPSPWRVEASEEAQAGVLRPAPGLSAAALAHRRTPAWCVVGGGAKAAALAVACPGAPGVRFLDVAPSPASRQWIGGVDAEDAEREEAEAEAREAARRERAAEANAEEEEEEEERARGRRRGGADADADDARGRRFFADARGRWWPETPAETSSHVLSVAAHPSDPGLIVGGSWNALCVLGHRRG